LRRRLRLEALSPLQRILAGGGLFALSILITLAILLSGGRRPAPAPPAEQARLGLQDFLLADSPPPVQPDIFLFREPQARWTDEQLRRFWVPPEEVILEILVRENDRRIDRLLQEVP
jgi:hypothetical protein